MHNSFETAIVLQISNVIFQLTITIIRQLIYAAHFLPLINNKFSQSVERVNICAMHVCSGVFCRYMHVFCMHFKHIYCHFNVIKQDSVVYSRDLFHTH